MGKNFEFSDLKENYIEIRPGVLLCAFCKNGGACLTAETDEEVAKVLDAVRIDSNIHIVLKTAFDEAGARTELYEKTTQSQRKRDLDILRGMGATPETVRTFQTWTELLREYIPKSDHICAPHQVETQDWKNCPNAQSDYYETGLKTFCSMRTDEDMVVAKKCSCHKIETAKTLSVRAHHFLCMICFVGGTHSNAPIDEDNLYEVWQRILKDPEIPVTVLEGPGECVICPPCYAFDTDSGLCSIACSLRDRKKDLDVFAKIGMIPGETHSAKEILQRIYKNIKNIEGLCAFEERRGFEWKSCFTHKMGTFERGMAIVAEKLNLDKE